MNPSYLAVLLYRAVLRILSRTPVRKWFVARKVNAWLFEGLFRHLRSPQVKVGKYRLSLDPGDHNALSIYGRYEPLTTDLVKRIVRKGDVALDVGANVGWFTLVLSELVGQTGRVYSFEPHPEHFLLLSKNIKQNKLTNVVPVRKAVADQNGVLDLYINEDCPGGHTLFKYGGVDKPMEVEVIRLDDFADLLTSGVDFVKMDIEGAEGQAIRGMSKILNKNRRIKIVTEFFPDALLRGGTSPGLLLQQLVNSGFTVHDIDRDQKAIIQVEDTGSFLKSLQTRRLTNIFCERRL
jgi:FkbM family methyltransferase